MCGVIALSCADPERDAFVELLEGALLLQHRGQDACGFATATKDGRISIKKGAGLVKDVVVADRGLMEGHFGVGHLRYPTNGAHTCAEIQPIVLKTDGDVVLCHNGNLNNTFELRETLAAEDIWSSHNAGDTELMAAILAHALIPSLKTRRGPSFLDLRNAVAQVSRRCQGSFACVSMIRGFGLIAFRDPFGIKPLVIGERKGTDSASDFMIASESSALQKLDFGTFRDIMPGQLAIIPSAQQSKFQHRPFFLQAVPEQGYAPDLFEYVYFSSSSSVMDGIAVYKSRLSMGEALAEVIMSELGPELEDIDCVVPVPEGGNVGALAVARCLGKSLCFGLVRSQHSLRTFIMPKQKQRLEGVRRKLSVVESELRGKNVLLIDDSIVRGTTSRELVKMVRCAGAQKVYLASLSPAIRYNHIYGIDLASERALIAHGRSTSEICDLLGAEGLFYLPLDKLHSACLKARIDGRVQDFEDGVFSGSYVTLLPL